jgi:thiamine-monophosphate kinase
MKGWSETELVELVRRLGSAAAPGMRVGIGDDAAVLEVPRGQELLVTTDLFVEGVHFRRRWLPAAAAGRRALCRALSDIAAMGGEPRFAFLSLAVPSASSLQLPASSLQPPASSLRPSASWVRSFLRGFAAAARSFHVTLAGGDTGSSGSGALLADVIILGTAPKGTAALRSGARPGDGLFVSGRLGAPAAALDAGRRPPPIHPRLALGKHLRSHRLITAMMDLSDGLSTDLNRLIRESGVGAEVECDHLPLAGTLQQALNGGEDYELLFTVPEARAASLRRSIAGVPLTCIGRITSGRGAWLVDSRGRRRRLSPGGWEHAGNTKTRG